MTVVETYGGLFFEPCLIKSKLAIVAVNQDDDKTLSESTNKQDLDAAIKIAREKILVLMLLNGANYQ